MGAAGVFPRLFPVSPGPRRLNIQKSIISAGGPSITEKSIENPSGRCNAGLRGRLP
jgi:hypothetical protein